MIQIGSVGTCAQVETKEFKKWAAKQARAKKPADDDDDDEDGAMTPPDARDGDDDDRMEDNGRRKDNRKPKRRRVNPATPTDPPEPRYQPVPSLTFAKAGEIEEMPKVRVFITVLVKELNDYTIDLYAWRNIVGYAFVFVAIDPKYSFKAAAEQMANEMSERLAKHKLAQRATGRRPNYILDVRQITYGSRDEATIHGYDAVTSASKFRSTIAEPYARYIGCEPVDENDHFSVRPFSAENYRAWCIEKGVCALQYGQTPEDTAALNIFVPELTVELTMQQADPANLVQCQWPFYTEFERYVLAQPLTCYKVSHIGRHYERKEDVGTANMVVLQSQEIMSNRPNAIGAIKTPYPFDRAAVQYRKVVAENTESRRTYIRIANELIARAEATMNEREREFAQQQAVDDQTERDSALGAMVAYLKALIPFMPVEFTPNDVHSVMNVMRDVEKAYLQVQRVLEEDYLTWMQPGNPELPISVRGLLDWGSARNGMFDDSAPLLSHELSVFGNFVYGINVLISAAFQVHGMISAFFAGFLTTLDAMDDHEGLRTHIYFYGDPAAGKSMILEILEKLLPFMTSNRESGGGSDKSAQYEDATNEVRFMHEAAPHLAGKRNPRDPRSHAKLSTHLDGMTSKSISNHVVKSTTDPVTGYTDYRTETTTARFPGCFIIASNDFPQDPAVRSRHILIEVRRPLVRASSLIVKAQANEVEAAAIMTRMVDLIGSYYYINAHIRKAITEGWIPTPSALLFDIQMFRFYEKMERLCVDDVSNYRKHLQIRRLYASAVMLDASTKAFFSPLSKRRELIDDDDGGVSLGPLRFEPWMVHDVVDFFVDNEEIAAMIGYVRFNELVSRFRHQVYRKLFTKLLASGEFDENQLATWVRYASYSDLVVQGPTAIQSAERPSFAEFGPTDLRSIYAYGSKLDERGIGVHDPFLHMQTPSPAVVANFAHATRGRQDASGTPSPMSTGYSPTQLELQYQQAARNDHPSNQEVVGSTGAASTHTLPRAPVTEKFAHSTGEKQWTSMDPSVIGMVPKLPTEYKGMCPNMDVFLQKVDKENNRMTIYDLNYLRVKATSMSSLVEMLAREIKYDETADATGTERSVKETLEQLTRGNIRAYPVRAYRAPQGHQLSMEEFGRQFLPRNLEPVMKDMHPIITVPHSDAKHAAEDIYVNIALLGITYELLRQEFLGVFSHKYTRERMITLGPTPNCVNEPMETFYLRPSDETIHVQHPAFKGSAVDQEVLSRYIGRPRVARDGVAPGTELAKMLQRVGSQTRTIVIDGDMEDICAADYKKEHNIPSGTMPADCDRFIQELFRGRRDENSERFFTFSYTAAVAEELRQDRARNTRHTATNHTARARAGPAQA